MISKYSAHLKAFLLENVKPVLSQMTSPNLLGLIVPICSKVNGFLRRLGSPKWVKKNRSPFFNNSNCLAIIWWKVTPTRPPANGTSARPPRMSRSIRLWVV